jgi:integrase
MSKQIENVKVGAYGQGALRRYDNSPAWYFCYSHNGQHHRESTKTPDLRAAKRFAKQRLDELAADRQGHATFVAPVAKRVMVSELIDDLLQHLELKGRKSVKKVGYHARPVREHFGNLRAGDVDASLIDRYVAAKQAAGLKPATINRQTQLLGAALKLAVRRSKLTTVPLITKLSEAGNAKQGFFEQADFEKVLTYLPDYLQGAAQFAYVTGWRRSEVTGLRWEWVDREAGTLTLPDSKNGRARVLALVGEVTEIVKAAESTRLVEAPDGDVRISDYIFHRKGQALGDFKNAWHSALEAAGFSYQEKLPNGKTRTRYTRCFHDFRRTAARNLVRAGVREGVAMAVTGHKTRSVFDRYNISSADDVREAIEAVSKRHEREA